MAIDYKHKAKILSLGLCKDIKQLDRNIYSSICSDISKAQDIAFEEMMFCIDHQCTPYDIEEGRRINLSTFKRVSRLKERIERYLSIGQCIWLTLTFSEDTLSKTSEETRRRYVSRFLKSQSKYYIANIDYGKTTEREHYHAVIVSDFVDMEYWKKHYGFAYTERIKNHIKTPTKLSKYVSKLCNHAIKETTKRAAYLYSRY